MAQRSGGLVQFISRAFGAAAGGIIVATAVFFALFYRRNADERWALHSREVSRLARELSIDALQRESGVRGTIALGAPVTLDGLEAGRIQRAGRLDSLRSLTAAAPAELTRVERIAAEYARWDSLLLSSRGRRPGEVVGQAAMLASEPSFRFITTELDSMIQGEERVYRQSVASARQLDRLILATAFIALAIVIATLIVVRRGMVGQARELSVSASALDLRNAQLIDQTGRLETAVEKMQVSEMRFRSLVDSLHDVVFTLGTDKRVNGIYGGKRTTRTAPLESYIGKTAGEVMSPEVAILHDEAADRALRGESATYEWQASLGADMRHFTTEIMPLRGPNGAIRGVVGITRDRTDQVLREQALSEVHDQLRQSQRLEALGQLAGGVAHDFNNLLTVIMTYAAMLHADSVPGTDESRSIEEIRLASERAAALTRQLLAFSRRQVLQPRPLDLNDTVRTVERMLRRLLPPDIIFETNLETPLATVMADVGQMEQVLVNLALNARDAMPEGGRLTISTANVSASAARSGTSFPGAHVRVTVRDTGVGMSPETMSKVFEPFFTTKGFGKGTGLGLATVYGIIEQSGGRVTVESEVGRGTTFSIRLPKLIAPVKAAPRTTLRPDLHGSETILLIDDNEELRRVVKRMLQRSGYVVIEAANGAAALTILDRGTSVDIVISDVMMPEMNGKAVVDAVRQRHQNVKLLLMSGYNYDTALRGMAQRGDIAFIEKPFTADKLREKLREVLSQPTGSGVA